MITAHRRRLAAWLALAALVANTLVGPAAHGRVMREAPGGGSDFCSAGKPPSHNPGTSGSPLQRSLGHHGSECACYGGPGGIVSATHVRAPFALAKTPGIVPLPEGRLASSMLHWPVVGPQPPPHLI